MQRREVNPSGPGTKVIVNAPLHRGGGLTKIFRPTEKHVQWVTPIDGKAVTYLFKFSAVKEANEMAQVLEDSQKPTLEDDDEAVQQSNGNDSAAKDETK